MLGAICGDVIGSVYEFQGVKRHDFPLFTPESRFTDDTVLTCATADHLLNKIGYRKAYKKWGQTYPHAGYGGMFGRWLLNERAEPYQSYGNGAAMRVSPVGFLCDTVEATLAEARKSAEVTHDHPEGIKGAQAVASAIFYLRQGQSKKMIKAFVQEEFHYDLDRNLDMIRPDYEFNATCQGSVPEAIIAFLESDSFEDAVRNAVSLGGDSDTIACIAGALAEAHYESIPGMITETVFQRLDPVVAKQVKAFYHSIQ
jgi:ADP-ribosylglycohydrolase